MVCLAYHIDRPDCALFSVVILFHHLFPLVEKVEIQAFILPCDFPAVLIIFTGRGGEPPLPRGAGRPSLIQTPWTPLQLRYILKWSYWPEILGPTLDGKCHIFFHFGGRGNTPKRTKTGPLYAKNTCKLNQGKASDNLANVNLGGNQWHHVNKLFIQQGNP